MKPSAYIETTVVSYLTARPSRDVVRRSHEILTGRWWNGRDRFQLYASQQVLLESSAGDPTAAAQRLEALSDIALLPVTPEAIDLAERLSESLQLPPRARADAVHIAVCARPRH